LAPRRLPLILFHLNGRGSIDWAQALPEEVLGRARATAQYLGWTGDGFLGPWFGGPDLLERALLQGGRRRDPRRIGPWNLAPALWPDSAFRSRLGQVRDLSCGLGRQLGYPAAEVD